MVGVSDALFVHGTWLRVRRVSLSDDRAAALQGSILTENEVEAFFDSTDCEELHGLVAGTPAEIDQASYTGGLLARTSVSPRAGGEPAAIDWTDPGAILIIQRATHAWAEWLGAAPLSAEAIAFRAISLELPDSITQTLSHHLLVPNIDGLNLPFHYPIFNPGEGFEEETRWLWTDATRCHAIPLDAGSIGDAPLPDIHDAATRRFQEALSALFADLLSDRIFGADAFGQGWRPGEGWDIVVEKVPEQIRAAFGWKDPSAMSLCWTDTAYYQQASREELASKLYGGGGMHDEYQGRVQIWRLPLPAPVLSAGIYYDGPTDAERLRIARQIVARAPAAGLAARWDGSVDRAIIVSMAEVEQVRRLCTEGAT